MPLLDRPDFQAWLARFEARHAQLHSTGLQPKGDRCDGCGEPIPEPVSSTGLCLVCLAETFGREQAQSAARVAGVLEDALERNRDAPIAEIRDAVEEVLERYERSDL
jgi:recombinational DNA repair protein (RecF pathway)